MPPSICIIEVDADPIVPLLERVRVAAALSRQVAEHFAPLWGVTATVRVATPDAPPRDDEWRLELWRVPQPGGPFGYHDVTPAGVPRLIVFPELASWSVCASHEVLEALADPYIRRCVQAPDGSIWALEVCDACEDETYVVDGVEVSDFCTPQWFEPPKAPTEQTRYSYAGRCLAPFHILPGGYGQVFDPKRGWQRRAGGELLPHRTTIADLGVSRGGRRRDAVPQNLPWWRKLLSGLVSRFS